MLLSDFLLLYPLIKKIANSNIKDDNVLYKALRMLDFALIYANASLGASQRYADSYFYESAAKYLALEAIRAHQSVWFANRKEKEINALLRQEQKTVNQLNQKELQKGVLTDEEYDYNKNQKEGMVICIEPMLNLGTRYVYMIDDNWTIKTDDGLPSAHYEHTILVTKDGYEILTPRLD